MMKECLIFLISMENQYIERNGIIFQDEEESEGYEDCGERLRKIIATKIPKEFFGENPTKMRRKSVGHGGCGDLYKVHPENNVKRNFVLKVVNSQAGYKDICGEYQYAKLKIDSPYLAKIYYCDPESEELIMEYYEGKDLSKIFTNKEKFDKQDLLIDNLLKALKTMHDNYIVHYDIKLENIIFVNEKENEHFVVCDFGSSRRISIKNSLRFDRGSLLYQPPEAISSPLYFDFSKVNTKSDIWSAGIVFYMVLSGYENLYKDFYEDFFKSTIEEIRKTERDIQRNPEKGYEEFYKASKNAQDHINKKIDELNPKYDKYKDLLKNMLRIKQNERYNVNQCLDYLNNINKNTFEQKLEKQRNKAAITNEGMQK